MIDVPPLAFLEDGPADARATLLFAHGAGAGMETTFMSAFAAGLAARGVRVVRFEFPYMRRQRASGGRRPPDRMPILEADFRAAIDALGVAAGSLAIGGKSMGGRAASLIADAAGVGRLLCLGYPFHPPARPQQLRVAHLKELRTPALIVQGSRDPFGTRAEVDTFELSKAIALHFIEDGDHSLEPTRKGGRTREECWQEAMSAIARFLLGDRG